MARDRAIHKVATAAAGALFRCGPAPRSAAGAIRAGPAAGWPALPESRPALRVQEFRHVRRARRRTRETGDPERLEHEPERALVLVEGGGRVTGLRFRAHHHPGDPPAAARGVARRLIEGDDQEAVPLER